MCMIPSITWAVTTAEVSTAAHLLWWLRWGKILNPSVVFLVFLFILKSLFLYHCGLDDTSQNSLYVRFDLSISRVCSWNWKHGVQLSFSRTAGHHFQWQMKWHGCNLMLKQLCNYQKELKILFDLKVPSSTKHLQVSHLHSGNSTRNSLDSNVTVIKNLNMS